MKKLLFTAISLSLLATSVSAAPSGGPEEKVFTIAHQPGDLLGSDGAPFQLGMDFIADPQTGTGPATGHFQLKWEAKDRWWRQIDMGGFRLTEIRVGNKLYTQRNAGFTPIAVREFLSLLEFAQVDQHRNQIAVKEQRRCKKGGVKAYCIKGELTAGSNEHHELVVSATENQVLSDDWSASTDQRRKEEFTNWMSLDKYRYYPRNLQLSVNGEKIVTASVTSLVAAPFDETLLIPPQGTVASR